MISASGRFSLARRGDLLERRPHLVVGAQVQHHAAHVGLVGDLRRVDLQHHRIAEPMGHLDRLVGGAGGLRLGHRDLVGLQKRLRDVLREDFAAFGQDRVEHAAEPLPIEHELQGNVLGRFVQDFADCGRRKPGA